MVVSFIKSKDALYANSLPQFFGYYPLKDYRFNVSNKGNFTISRDGKIVGTYGRWRYEDCSGY